MKDLEDVFSTDVKILVVGLGHSGVMKIDPEVREHCRKTVSN
jgi:hypothetical protein